MICCFVRFDKIWVSRKTVYIQKEQKKCGLNMCGWNVDILKYIKQLNNHQQAIKISKKNS